MLSEFPNVVLLFSDGVILYIVFYLFSAFKKRSWILKMICQFLYILGKCLDTIHKEHREIMKDLLGGNFLNISSSLLSPGRNNDGKQLPSVLCIVFS